jgi:hypothetical protein
MGSEKRRTTGSREEIVPPPAANGKRGRGSSFPSGMEGPRECVFQ